MTETILGDCNKGESQHSIPQHEQTEERGDHWEWSTIKLQLSMHQRSRVIITGEDDQINHIRVSGTPETVHRDIYKKLGVRDSLKTRDRII